MAKSDKNSEKTKENAENNPICSNLQEFGAMIRGLRHTRSMTLDQLAAATGISKPYLSNIETARLSGPPSPELLSRLETGLGAQSGTLLRLADWLRTPDSIRLLMPQSATTLPRHSSGTVNLDAILKGGQPAKGSTLAPAKKSGTGILPVTLRQVPLINRVAAGKPAEFTDLDYPAGVADAYIPSPQPDSPEDAEQNLFALRIDGDSMEPDYHAGDIIVLSATQMPQSGQDCLVRLDEAENFSTTFKRVYFVDSAGKPSGDGQLAQLVPLNPQHKTRTIERSQISGLFPAVWKITPAGRGDGKPSATIPQTKIRKTRRDKPREEIPGLSSDRKKLHGFKLRPASSSFSIEND